MVSSVSALMQHRIKSFQEFRTGLLDLKKADLAYNVLFDYRHNNGTKLAGIAAGTHNQIGYLLESLKSIDDVDVLDAGRDELVRIIDDCLIGMTGEGQVRPVLSDLILKVSDTKLSTLLREFNSTKDGQPNVAAIALRTILCLIILEKAKLAKPQGKLAHTTDLKLSPMLQSAIDERIFAEGETKLLQAFQKQGLKETFDNIVHKPGETALISKDDLSSLVQNTVNKLLAEICN